MKLKKIASLALAGLMAVSMLAGCGNNANGGNNVDTGVTSSVVDAVNNGQDSYNKVKVTFNADSKLQDAAEKAIAAYGNYPDLDALKKDIKQYANLLSTISTPNDFMSDTKAPTKDGEKVTFFDVVLLGTGNMSEAYLNSVAADYVNELVAKLDDTTLVTADDKGQATEDGATYYDFSYTGKICMVSTTATYGLTVHAAVIVVEQTATAKTV